MPFVGKKKDEDNAERYFIYGNKETSGRMQRQLDYWPEVVKKLDEKLNGQHYKSEVLSYTDLWYLYHTGKVKGAGLSEEDEARGKNEDKKPKSKKEMTGFLPITTRRYLNKNHAQINFRYNEVGYLHYDQWLRARDQCRKELFWLCKEVFALDVVPRIHQQVCNQFVQKDFDNIFKEGYTLDDLKAAMTKQNRIPRIWVNTSEYISNTVEDFGKYIFDPIESENPDNFARTMLLLDPRGYFKSTIDSIDIVQWIINCPDVRVLLFGGVISLTLQFLKGTKARFYQPRGQRPTAFQLLFPEYVVGGIDGSSEQPLITPARIHDDIFDPTLGIISIGSSLSGFHCDIAKFDDVVTDTNSDNEDVREKIRQRADGAENLLMPWGWLDIIGTRYWVDDYYGTIIKSHIEDPITLPLKYFCRSAWYKKPGCENTPLKQLTEEMVEMTFPEQSSFKYNRRLLNKNERLFRCQQLNEPAMDDESFTVHFPEDLLENHVMPASELQAKFGKTIITCDTARASNKYSDYSVLVAGRLFRKENKEVAVGILDIWYGQWPAQELARKVAEFHRKWNPEELMIENTGGLALFFEEVQRQSMILSGQKIHNMYPKKPENDKDAKRNRIKSIEILLRTNLWYFAPDFKTDWWDETVRQFTNYKGQRSGQKKKDDIPDTCSFLVNYMPRPQLTLSPEEQTEQAKLEEEKYKRWLMKEMHKQIFGDRNINQPLSAPVIDSSQSTSPYGNITRKLFGDNGLRA